MQRTLFCTRAIKTLTPSESNHSTTAALLPLTLHRRSCHMLRFGLHMPLQGTSERRPRALQITARSSSYLQPTIIAARGYLYDGATLQQLPRSSEQKAELQPGSFFCSVTWKQHVRVWLSFHRCSSVESIPGISPQTVRSGNVCKANSREWRGGLLQAPYPRACTHSTAQHPPTATPLEAHIHVRRNSVQLSNPHNAELWRETPTQTQTSVTSVCCSKVCVCVDVIQILIVLIPVLVLVTDWY